MFTVGKVIPVRIIAVDQSTGKLVASARQAQTTTAQPSSFASVEVGNVLSGEITHLHDSNVVLALQPSGVKALISYTTLARHRRVSVDALRTELAKGQTVDDLVVVSKNVDKAFVIVGLVPSKAAKDDASPSDPTNAHLTFETLQPGQTVSGRVCGKVPTGLLVQVSRSIRGRVPKVEISDDYDNLTSPSVAIGAHVQCLVLSVDAENHRVDLSLRASKLQAGVPAKDIAVASVDDLKPGQTIRGFVKNIANHGLFVALGGDVTARVLIKVRLSRLECERVPADRKPPFSQELFDEFVKEWKPRFAVGQLVEGKITT